MAGTGGTTTYTPMSVLTGTTLLPKPVVKPVVTVRPVTTTSSSSGSASSSSGSSSTGGSSSVKKNTVSGSSSTGGSSSVSKNTISPLQSMMSSSGVQQKIGMPMAAASTGTTQKDIAKAAFMKALAAAAQQNKALPNPTGLSSDEADKLRSQFYTDYYSRTPVPQVNALSSAVNQRIDPALLDYLRGPFPTAPAAPAQQFVNTVPAGMGIDFGQITPGAAPAAPFMPQGVRPGQPSGMPAAPFIAQGVRPGQPSGMPAAPAPSYGALGAERPGVPTSMLRDRNPNMPADQLNARGIASRLLDYVAPQRASSEVTGGGFDLMNLLIGQAQGAEYPTRTPADPYPFYAPAYQGVGGQVVYNSTDGYRIRPTDPNRVAGEVTPVPTRTYRAGQVNPLDVLLAQIGSFSPFADAQRSNALIKADPFYQAGRVGATNPILGDVLTTPSAYDTSGFATGPMYYYDATEVAPRPVPAQSMTIPNRMDEEAIANELKTPRLNTADGVTRDANYDKSLGYPLPPDVAGLQKGPPVPVTFPPTAGIDGAINPDVAPVTPRERPSLFDFAVSNPGWAIEKMRAIEDAGTMADNSDYGNLVSGLENSPYRTADMMSQSAKLRAAEDYANANGIEVSDEYGGSNDKSDQLLQIYKAKVEPNLPKSGGTTAGAVFTPGPGQFVGTNGYVYEQSGDGSFKQVGKVPGYTDAQLYEAANKGAFRNPNAIPVGSAPKKKTAAKKKPSDNTVKASEDGGLLSWLTDIQNGLDDFRAENRRNIGLSPRNKKADGGMVNKYGGGGIASWITEGSKEAKAIMDPPTRMEQLAAAGWSPSMMEGSPSTSSRNTSAKNSDGKAGSGSSSTTTTTSGAPAGYTPPTQAQIDALYAPYFQQAVMPPATYVPGLSGEFNYFPTMPKPVTPPSNPLIQSGTAASDWFNKYMNAKNQGDKKSARKDIATGTTTFHSLFDKYRSALGNKAQPSLQSWLDWYGKQSFAEGGAVLEPRLVLGHGGPTSDNIPANIDGVQEARLSNGEFVMTAAAVKNAGDGDMQKGAERLMHLNEMLSYGRPAGKLNVEKVAGKAK